MKRVAPACALALCALATSPARAQDTAHLTLKCPGSTVMVDGQGQASCPSATPPAPVAAPAATVDSAEDAAMKRRLGHDFTFATPVADTTAAPAATPAAATPAAKTDNPLLTRLQPESTPTTHASLMRGQNLIVGKGTLIPCGTINEINTTLPGLVTCRVSHDVYSINGKVRLIDKGAVAEGEVTSALQYGQNRIFVNWLRLRNPEGVSIDLLSPGTTPLGGSGVKGKVNTHFWARFGDAIMVSIITNVGQMMVQAITNLASKPGTTSITTSSDDTNSVVSQVEKIILNQTSNVPPSLYVQQGNMVQIYVARDLDFSSVYTLAEQ
ncbi:TrbI/VirB10 family protein [Komagataeibacter sucrofermentans]|uniref:Type IV secretion system protein VirB10 n=1 Tax=Komagataeibacter sucrofermentans TaxID=1053551 RepID=A0A318QNV9_9PROT|nr:TrbI/VirB10 family protein [Komagataeibacter sucrofermentans]PYD80110.1 type IV secretion system protein VirB10 [Komagataeibacter sucrofermentans]GBQ48538.1 type IV secretion system protein VirB10 [Komagataeibacter sucrofermentans DSM 15973]